MIRFSTTVVSPPTGLVDRVLRSPTLMTWGSLGVRVLGLAILVPLVLNKFTVEEANLWLLFGAILSLQSMVDFGFSPTFIRAVAYARTGRIRGDEQGLGAVKGPESSYSMERIVGTMRSVYNLLGLAALVLLVLIGSAAVANPIAQTQEVMVAWWAWLAVILGGVLRFRRGMYVAYLQGVEKIALCRRWEIVTEGIALFAAIIVLLGGGGLIELVLTIQAGALLSFIATRTLTIRNSKPGIWITETKNDKEVMALVWPAAWRSGLGVALTFGTIQGTGVLYAQLGSPADSAAFLLALKAVRILSGFANASFYTRIPRLSRLYAENRWAELTSIARIGMLRSNWVFVAGAILVGVVAAPFLRILNSDTPFVPLEVWWVLAVAILLERIGAMHLQLYSTSNHIVWHVANVTAGILMLSMIPITYYLFGVVGFPVGIAAGYALFYVPYCLRRSYRKFGLTFSCIDKLASAPPFIALLLASLISLSTA